MYDKKAKDVGKRKQASNLLADTAPTHHK